MKMSFKVIPITILALVCLGFTSCIIEHQEIPLETREPWGIPPYSGTRTATANGWFENSVIVTITLANGIITNVHIDASAESAGFREMAISQATPIIGVTNSFHIPGAVVDGVSGATYTLRGIVRAGSQALLQIPGVEEEDLGWIWDWEWSPPPGDGEDMG